MIVNVIGGPVQVTPPVVIEAVTVKVAVIGPVVLLTPRNVGINPVPEVGFRPIFGPAVCDQLIVAPGTVLVNTIAGTWVWKQKILFVTGFTMGDGFTVMVNVIAAPGQGEPVVPVKVANTVNVEVIGAPLVLVAVNAGTLPVPFVGSIPISGVGTVRDHVNTTPGMLLLNTIDGIFEPAHTVWFGTALTVGTGLIVMVN